ncbi:MAG TPA: carbohydrate ABC transporter permease [Acidimicrobiales bacterium]|nr:carbohydrate ABC transporter permease [Acidimicrobiales bacterium]
MSRLAAMTRRSAVQAVLLVVAVFWLVPTLGLLVTSVRPVRTYGQSGWWEGLTKPAELTLQAYRGFFEEQSLVESIWNTFLITVPTTLLVVLIASMAGYAFAWLRFPGRDLLFLVVVGLLVVPLQMALIPVFQLYRRLGVEGIPAVVLFHVAFGLPFAVFLLRNFFAGIPRDLFEAARLDGASEWRIFFRVVLPLGAPAIAALAIFQFLWVWNDLLVALIFAGDTPPLTVAIARRLGQFGSNIGVIAPGAFISMAVPLAVFFAFQRHFEAGLLGGSVK